MRLILEKTADGIFCLIDADESDPQRAEVGSLIVDPAREMEILCGLVMAAADAELNKPIIQAASAIEQRQTTAEPIGRHHASAGTYGHAEGARCAMRNPWVPEEQRICTCGFDLIDNLIKAVRDRQRRQPREPDESREQAQRRRASLVNPEMMKKLQSPRRDVSTGLNLVHFLITAWIADGGQEGKECTYLEALEKIILELVERHEVLSRQCSDLFLALDSEEYQTCSECGRKTWARSEFSQVCAMTQPDGRRCTGVFR